MSQGAGGYDSSRGTQARIEQFYDVGSRLTADACGAGGEVMRGIRLEDRMAFAIKIIRLDKTREDKSQIKTLTEVNHRGIIRLIDWFETPTMLYVVMELAMGGEMFGRIAERGAFSEKDAAAAFRQVVEAIGHMHSRGIVHCDLKPENILYEDDTDKQIKIADFGFAQFLPGGSEETGQRLYKQLGTLSYTAPEILAGTGYGTKADMWSLGVILYILLSGIPPFGKRRGETDRDVKRNIMRGNYRFYESHFKHVSQSAQDLVRKLIVVDPAARLSWEQALQHEWILGNAPDQQLGGEYIIELGNFNQRRGMYKLASHGLAGLVSRFAQPDTIAAISADTSSLSRVLQEGSIQPIISLAYSKMPDDRQNACHAIANLALKEEYQSKLIAEGGVRRLNQLVMKEGQSRDVKFFIALALARIAKNPDLRIAMLEETINADTRCNTFTSLMKLSEPPPVNPSRAQRQAAEALSLLALEDQLHEKLVMGGALPPLIRQAQVDNSSEFRRTALQALRRIMQNAVTLPLEKGAVSVKAINDKLKDLYQSAYDKLNSSESGEVQQAQDMMGAFSSVILLVKQDGILEDLCKEDGDQPWHNAIDLFNKDLKLPERMDGAEDLPSFALRSASQIFNAIDLTPYRQHLLEAHDLLKEVLGKPVPSRNALDRQASEDEQMMDAHEEHDDDSTKATPLEPQKKAKLEQIHARLTQDRGKLLEVILGTSKGRRCNVPEPLQQVCNELTDVILLLSDTINH